jgi:hypothetical protein
VSDFVKQRSQGYRAAVGEHHGSIEGAKQEQDGGFAARLDVPLAALEKIGGQVADGVDGPSRVGGEAGAEGGDGTSERHRKDAG